DGTGVLRFCPFQSARNAKSHPALAGRVRPSGQRKENGMHSHLFRTLLAASGVLAASGAAWSSPEEDRQTVAALDTRYQEAVKRNDADTMGQILDEHFILVLGNGTVHTREELLAEARKKSIDYEQQDEDPGTQTVRVWGDTA